MQVLGLPGNVIRNSTVATRLLAPVDRKTLQRRDTVIRWRQAMRNGLSAKQAARAVNIPLSTLYRWRRRPELLSRCPHRLRREGHDTSAATVGRLIRDMVAHGRMGPGQRLRPGQPKAKARAPTACGAHLRTPDGPQAGPGGAGRHPHRKTLPRRQGRQALHSG